MSLRAGAVLGLALLTPARVVHAQEPVSRPPEDSDSAVAAGRRIFEGAGNCIACHGAEGAGTDSGPALAQGVWLHGPDSYEAIVSRITHGVPRDRSLRNTAMPMRGWTMLTDEEVRIVAAYVWWISHPRPRH